MTKWPQTFCPSFFFLVLSSVCAICLPSVSPQTVFVKYGGDHRGFLSIWPRRALHLFLSQLDLSHTSAFYCRLTAGSWPMALLVSLCPSHYYCEPPYVGNKPTYLHILFTFFLLLSVKPPLNLKALILVIQELYDQVWVIHKRYCSRHYNLLPIYCLKWLSPNKIATPYKGSISMLLF